MQSFQLTKILFVPASGQKMERETGIEPAYPAWKAGALATVLLSHYLNLIKRPYIVKD